MPEKTNCQGNSIFGLRVECLIWEWSWSKWESVEGGWVECRRIEKLKLIFSSEYICCKHGHITRWMEILKKVKTAHDASTWTGAQSVAQDSCLYSLPEW
jgi:hypothetical protein